MEQNIPGEAPDDPDEDPITYSVDLKNTGYIHEAAGVFSRMLWLSPSDNQGVRFLIDGVTAKRPWDEFRHM